MDEPKGAFDKVVEEHRELRRTIQQLRDELAAPEPDIADERSHEWAETMAQRFLKLHDSLSLHFREEQRSGVLEQLVGRFPRAQRTIAALEEEHDDLLGKLRALVADTMSYAERKPSAGLSVREKATRLLEQLHQHEERETELIERLYCEDLGVGD